MDLRGKHRPCAVKVPACLLIHLPRGQDLSWGCLCSCHMCWAWRPSPALVPSSGWFRAKSQGRKRPRLHDRVLLVRVSITLSSCRSGQQPQERQPLANDTGAVEASASRPSVLSRFHPHRDPGRRVVAVPVMRSPQLTLPLVSRRSLLHLIGGEALRWSQNCLPQGNPYFIAY